MHALRIAVSIAAVSFSSLAAAQVTSVDLSTYTRVGVYNLPEPNNTPGAGSLLAQEASAVTYNRSTDTLFIVGDGGRAIVQVTKTGQLIDFMTLATGSSPQGTAFYDPEGLTWIGGSELVMAEERDRTLNRFTYAPGTTLGLAGAQRVKLGTTIGNVGFEGVSFDPATGGYVIVKENSPQSIFQTTVDWAAGTASNGSPTATGSTNLFNPTLMGLVDLADVFALSNVLPTASTQYQDLLVLSHESGEMIVVSRTGVVKSRLLLGPSAANPATVAQGHEGITMDDQGFIYIVNEEGGGSAAFPQLWVYAPIPEPQTYGLLALGLLLAGGVAMRRQRQR